MNPDHWTLTEDRLMGKAIIQAFRGSPLSSDEEIVTRAQTLVVPRDRHGPPQEVAAKFDKLLRGLEKDLRKRGLPLPPPPLPPGIVESLTPFLNQFIQGINKVAGALRDIGLAVNALRIVVPPPAPVPRLKIPRTRHKPRGLRRHIHENGAL